MLLHSADPFGSPQSLVSRSQSFPPNLRVVVICRGSHATSITTRSWLHHNRRAEMALAMNLSYMDSGIFYIQGAAPPQKVRSPSPLATSLRMIITFAFIPTVDAIP